MIGRATFQVLGKLILTDHFPISSDGIRISFNAEGDLIRAIVCEFKVDSPPIVASGEGNVSITAPESSLYGVAKRKLLAFQGVAALFCSFELDLGKPVLEWLAEPGEPRPDLLRLSFDKSARQPPPMNFDVLAKAIIESSALDQNIIALNFMRRGQNEHTRDQFVFAFMNFFLMLERLFGRGKFHKKQLLESFEKSPILFDAIEEKRKEFLISHVHKKDQFYIWLKKNHEPSDIISYLVQKRGSLFHNSTKGPADWSPEEQAVFRSESTYLLYLCSEVGMTLIEPIFSASAKQRYHEAARITGAVVMSEITFEYLDEDNELQKEHCTLQSTGTKLTNFVATTGLAQILNHFNDDFPGMRLKRVMLHDRTGELLIDVSINV